MGLLKAEKKEYAAALKYLLEAARRMPEYTRINYNISLLYQQLGKMPEAEKYLQKCLAADPRNYDYLYAAATFYLQRGDRKNTIRYATLLKQYFPDNPAGENILKAANQQTP
jgi:tetratricopeptide (TPR) repeat protein